MQMRALPWAVSGRPGRSDHVDASTRGRDSRLVSRGDARSRDHLVDFRLHVVSVLACAAAVRSQRTRAVRFETWKNKQNT